MTTDLSRYVSDARRQRKTYGQLREKSSDSCPHYIEDTDWLSHTASGPRNCYAGMA